MLGSFLSAGTGEQSELFAQNRSWSKSFLILFLKILRRDFTGCIDYKDAWIRNPIIQSASCNRRIQNAERSDDLRSFVREQREADFHAIREILKYSATVITDSRHAKTTLYKIRPGLFQLHELRLAIGSPVRGTKEQKHQT